MSYCPLSCSSHGYMPSCKGPECELTDEAGDCLIKQALSLYVSGERTKRAEEAEKSRRETEMALNYWEYMKNNNLRKAECIIEDPSPCFDQVIDSI